MSKPIYFENENAATNNLSLRLNSVVKQINLKKSNAFSITNRIETWRSRTALNYKRTRITILRFVLTIRAKIRICKRGKQR
jgi:hypothetical protein